MKILFLSRWYPYPATNGSKIRIFNLVRGLGSQHSVTLISFFQPNEGAPDPDELLKYCKRVEAVPYRGFQPKSRKSILGFLSPIPRAYLDTYSEAMRKAIEDALRNETYDLVIASQVDMAVYAQLFGSVPAIFEEVEIGVLYDQFHQAESLAEKFRKGLTWNKHKYFMQSLLSKFSACTVVSRPEKLLVTQFASKKCRVEVIPNCVDVDFYQQDWGKRDPNQVIFTGSFRFSPNYTGARWLVEEVLPVLRQSNSLVQVVITGDHANLDFPQVNGVSLLGFVEDIRPYVGRSWCSVAPLFQGGGTRLKILEAMAMGTPVVATTKGAEGLDAEHGKHLLIADTPHDFASAIHRLMQNPDFHQEIAQNGLNLVRERYDWPVVRSQFQSMIGSLQL